MEYVKTAKLPLNAQPVVAAFLNELIDNGFRVFVHETEGEIKNFYYSENGQIGEVSITSFGEFQFSTIHVPNERAGSGFVTSTVTYPTLEQARRAFSFYPEFFGEYERKNCVKYDSLEDFFERKLKPLWSITQYAEYPRATTSCFLEYHNGRRTSVGSFEESLYKAFYNGSEHNRKKLAYAFPEYFSGLTEIKEF